MTLEVLIEKLRKKQIRDKNKLKIIEEARKDLYHEILIVIHNVEADLNIILEDNQILITCEGTLLYEIVFICNKHQKVLVYFNSSLYNWSTQKYHIVNKIYDAILKDPWDK